MPDYIIVQCFQCNLFQAGQRRKDAKFTCKVCGASQSVRRVFARSGRAADLRPAVQAANLARGTAEGSFDNLFPSASEVDEGRNLMEHRMRDEVNPAQSRWATHVATVDNPYQPQASDAEDGGDFLTALPDLSTSSARKRKRQMAKARSSKAARTNDGASGDKVNAQNDSQDARKSRWSSALETCERHDDEGSNRQIEYRERRRDEQDFHDDTQVQVAGEEQHADESYREFVSSRAIDVTATLQNASNDASQAEQHVDGFEEDAWCSSPQPATVNESAPSKDGHTARWGDTHGGAAGECAEGWGAAPGVDAWGGAPGANAWG